MRERILTIIKGLRKMEDSLMLTFALERSFAMVQAYLNQKEIDDEALEGVLVELTLKILDRELEAEGASRRIKSIKEGEVSVSFAEGVGLLEEALLEEFKTELNRFRKMGW